MTNPQCLLTLASAISLPAAEYMWIRGFVILPGILICFFERAISIKITEYYEKTKEMIKME